MTAPAKPTAKPTHDLMATRPGEGKTAAADATKAPKAKKPSKYDNESKADKFRRLGGKRLGKVLKAMKGLEALGRGQYEYSDAQANKVVQMLVDGVASVKSAFAARSSKATQEVIDL